NDDEHSSPSASSSKNAGCTCTALALLTEHRGYETASQNHANSTQETKGGPNKVENRENCNPDRSTHGIPPSKCCSTAAYSTHSLQESSREISPYRSRT